MRVLISGPPASGKSTLARQLAAVHSATVVDFDEVARELGSDARHDHPDDVRRNTHAEIDRRLDALSGPAVVIRSAPTAAERQELAQRLGADRVLVLAVPADEAKRRAAADNRPDWTPAAIDRWWSRYEPDESHEAISPTSSETLANPKESAAMADQQTPPEGEQPPPGQNTTPPGGDAETDDGKGGKRQVLADLAAERDKRQQLEQELDDLRRSTMNEQERAVDEAKSAGRTEALAEVNGRLFAAHAVAAAAKSKIADPDLLSDPEVALRLLGLQEVPVTPTGDIDAKVISASVAELVKNRPYLAGETQAGPIDLGQGARGSQPAGGDMNASIRRAAGRA